MSEDSIIELQYRLLSLNRTKLVQFVGEMKWVNVENVGEKSRLQLMKIFRTAFENYVDKCEGSQLASLLDKIRTVLDGVSASQDDGNVKEKDKNTKELQQLKTQCEKLVAEQEVLKNIHTYAYILLSIPRRAFQYLITSIKK